MLFFPLKRLSFKTGVSVLNDFMGYVFYDCLSFPYDRQMVMLLEPMKYHIQQREMELRQEEAEKHLEEARKNRGFAMIFDDIGTAALRAVAEKSGQAISLFFWLAREMDAKGAVIITNNTLAAAMGIPASNISRSLRILRDAGVIATMTTGGGNCHCINPDIAWRSTDNGKKYALFHAVVVVPKEEMDEKMERAKRNLQASEKGMRLKTVRGKVLIDKRQQEFEAPIGPNVTEVSEVLPPET